MTDTQISLSEEAAAWGEGAAPATGNCTWLGPRSSHRGLPRSRDGRFSWSLMLHWELRLPHVTCDNGENLDCGFQCQLCCDPRQMI